MATKTANKTSKKSAQAPGPKVEVKPIGKTLNLSEVENGHVFSEFSHYQLVGRTYTTYGPSMTFKHLQTGTNVTLSEAYVKENLQTADQYHTEVTVGKEDKLWTQKQVDELKGAHGQDLPRVGDIRIKGIRTIFEEIHNAHVFTVCFETQGKDISETAYNELRANQIANAIAKIEAAQKSKKGILNVAKDAIAEIQENPVQRWEKGDDRVLRGYKVQFTSRDGRYNCVDMDITEKHNVRPVNINTIKWLVFDGIRYVVE